MSVQAFIEKFPEFVHSKVYEYLRTKGITYIQQLASEKWTDHNIHDPGITCLEMICYAITDLGYKTDYAIEDILAEASTLDFKTQDNKNIDTIVQSLTGSQTNSDTFFTPRQILPCNALTLADWRKVIVDVHQVRNAWLLMLEESEPPIYSDPKASELSFTPNKRTRRLNLDGLYEVNLEFEVDETLGDLNSWEYSFPLSNSGLKLLSLYFKPHWQVFFENDLDPGTFDHSYMGNFTSIEDTAIYSGIFYLKRAGLTVPFEVNIESPLSKTDSNKAFIDSRIINELDEIGAFLKERISKCVKTVKLIESRVHQQRNLCEDFVRFKQSEVEEVAICTDIEIRPDSDTEQVLANIYYALENFFSPLIPFYSLLEMQEMGYTLDAIFNGPALQHGFVKEEDIEAADYRPMVHVSDIIQVLMDIDGIVAIKNIQLSKYLRGLVLNEGEDWCLSITENRALKFNTKNSKIVFYKGLIPYKARQSETLEILEDLRALDYRSRLQAEEYDLEPPQGKDHKLRHYHSIQNDFPLVYGVGSEGLAPSSTDLRKAQAKQLKAFLKLVDQILANYCAQLANIKNLFSLNTEIKRTYFSQLLFSLPVTFKITQSTLELLAEEGWSVGQINLLQPLLNQPGIEEEAFTIELQSLLGNSLYQQYKSLLLDICKIPEIEVPNLPNGSNLVREFVVKHQGKEIEWDRPSGYQAEWQQYLLDKKESYWNRLCQHDELLENSKTYEDRKNQFLDHLLARFGEQFTDYVLLSTHMDSAKSNEDLIIDKINFLKDYPRLSRDRGKGFDCKVYGDPTNVSGLEIRGSRLVGIDNWYRSRLIPDYTNIFETFEELDTDGIPESRFRLRDMEGNILFSSTRHYLDANSLQVAMETALECGTDREQYVIKANKNGEYHFILLDKDKEIITRRRKYFRTKFEVEQAIQKIIHILKYKATRLEGFHLVEHILLRPISELSHLFKVSLKSDCSPGYQDPYSFRATAVVPYWPQRFQDMDFRRFFEDTLRKEVPAHIHLKICWVDQEAMDNFEDVFFRWLKLKTTTLYTHPMFLDKNQALIDEQDKLLHLLENFNSIYPEAHLFDCTKESDSKSILLNHSKLGSNKGN
ncbi:hypothetical protein [Aliikangiella coralliicola]|uniref:Uncharacterized protein n=1 Tax=Aliikangiella coralliicola TaxID=2592383 RepID=A0A545UD90_9GAMM|nr:hypothetical protein [Aliikangiella coralliicola]TQV87430.1 hypothetical protein FLL46_13380 [Aliikangiella coralliicola]